MKFRGLKLSVSLESALKVGLEPYDNQGGILPIVADLATTDETAWDLCIRDTKAWSNLDSSITEKRRAVEVGLGTTKAGPEIAANVPPGPVIDGRGRRCLRESGRSDQSSDGDNDCQLLHDGSPKQL
jgi:hypothetical protein